ncbi:hypothetical protein MFRU_032g01080 [Monilinia fructicola]|nr:hypothetical protein MFRU_032g01080 [Monilinia fructicola]
MTSPSIDPRIPKIHPFYRTFLLNIEPIFALSGAYLSLFHPTKFITSTAPSTLSSTIDIQSSTSDPLIKFLTADIGALYLLFTINEALVLRLTRDYSVWKAVVFAMLVCDLGHLWGVYEADPIGSLDVHGWTSDEWINNGILIFGAVLRIAFLSGLGNKK